MEQSLTYLALGDSYTIGEAVAEAERWPALLAAALSESGLAVATPDYVATTGWTTDELQAGIAAREDLAEQYDLVSLLIGVNNQYRGWPLDTYEQEFRALLDYAISKSKEGKDKVFVVSIPDYAYTPEGGGKPEISEGVARFNGVAQKICLELQVPFLNITPVSTKGLQQAALVATDGLHPSGQQYRLWVEEVIFDAVSGLFRD